MNNNAFYCILSIIFASCGTPKAKQFEYKANSFTTTIIDKRDNIQYGIVEIGNQKWFAENLKFETPESNCYRRKNANCEKYGRLYPIDDLATACPSGWRVPNVKDWKVLKSNFQKDSIFALLDTSNWIVAENHSNQSGLSLAGVGYQMEKKLFLGEGRGTSIWLNQMNKFDEYYHVHLYGGKGTYFEKSNYRTNEVFHAHPISDLKNRRFSIRCVCDTD